jgi:hypothetical protein
LDALAARHHPGPHNLLVRQRTPAEVTAAIDELRARPGFDGAMRRLTVGLLKFNDENPVEGRTFADIPALALGSLAIHLDANGGLHHRALQALSGAGGLISAGRATAVLWRMRRLGLVVPDSAYQSGKQRRFKPQSTLIGTLSANLRAHYEALAPIDADAQRVMDNWDDPATFQRLNSAMIRILLASIRRGDVNAQPLHGVSFMAMGIPITLTFIEAAFSRGHDVAEGPVTVSLSQVSRRWGVSRSQARRVAHRLERAGLRSDPSDAQRYELTPTFRDSIEIYFGGVFRLMLDCIALM